jgi:hypothetical protein
MWPFTKPKKPRDVNQLIFDCAEYHRPKDTQELIACLMRTELFAAVSDGPNLPNGTRYLVGPNDKMKVAACKIGNLHCVAFYTDRIDTRLRHPCIGLTGEEVMRMVLKSDADGFVVQNNKNSYFGLERQGIRDALGLG